MLGLSENVILEQTLDDHQKSGMQASLGCPGKQNSHGMKTNMGEGLMF